MKHLVMNTNLNSEIKNTIIWKLDNRQVIINYIIDVH
jgi:hypothetical protein